MRGEETAIARVEDGKPLIIALWHGRLLMCPLGWRFRDRSHVLVSAHSDGRLISRVLTRLNIRTITGSTGRGGADAIRRMRAVLHNGGIIGITPDGPRGPRMRVNRGVVQLARLTGAPIFPLTYAASPSRIFDSWDRFVFPLPFCRGLHLWGDPIEIPRNANDAELEAVRQELEESLNALTRCADMELGQIPVDPAPVPGSPSATVPAPINEAATS